MSTYILGTLAALAIAALACRFGPRHRRTARDIVNERRMLRAWGEGE